MSLPITSQTCDITAFPYCALLADFFREIRFSNLEETIDLTLKFIKTTTEADYIFYLTPDTVRASPPASDWADNTDLASAISDLRKKIGTKEDSATRAPAALPEHFKLLEIDIGRGSLASIGIYHNATPPAHVRDALLDELTSITAVVLNSALDHQEATHLAEQRKLQLSFLKEVLEHAIRERSGLCSSMLEACSRIIPSKRSEIWLVNNYSKTLTLRCQRGAVGNAPNSVLTIEGSVIGLAWKKNGTVILPGTHTREPTSTSTPKTKAQESDTQELVLLPIRTEDRRAREDIEAILAIYPSHPRTPLRSDDLAVMSSEIATALEIARESENQQMLEKLTESAQRSPDLSSYLYRVAQYLARQMRVQGVSIFVWDETRQRILLGHSTGMQTPKKKAEIYYRPGEGKTGKIFEMGEELVLQGEDLEKWEKKRPPRYIERTRDSPVSFLGAPVFGVDKGSDRGKARARRRGMAVIGVIRCVNKRAYVGEHVDSFSNSDVERIKQAASLMSPHFQVFQGEQQRVGLLSRISHEILSPVTSIRGTADHIKQKGDKLSSKEAVALADDIFTHATTLRMLSGGINMANARQAGLKKFRRRQVSLISGIIEPCINMAKPLARNQGLKFDAISLKNDEDVEVHTDKWAAQQIMFNLLTNSIKYRDRSKGARFRVDVSFKKARDSVSVEVSDDGMGVEAGDAEKIFDYGFRSRKVFRWDVTGIGLGLFISLQIARDLGGDLTLESNAKPTTFCVKLPRKGA